MPQPNGAFDFSLPKQDFPRGWGKSARSTKADFYSNQVTGLLNAGSSEAMRLNTLEDSRGQQMQDIVGNALPAANAPTWTDQAFNEALGQGTDASAQDYLHGMDSLRTQLGGAGITGGGTAAGLATGMELSRLGQITDSRRALYIQRTKDDALDRARNFQNTLTYANAVNRTPSSVYMNFLGDAAGIRLGQQGSEQARSSAKDAASASKSAGLLSAGSSLLGAAIGAL